MKRCILLVTLVVAAVVLLLPSVAAAAAYTWQFSFGSYGAGDGQFGDVLGMDVDPATGWLYVADGDNNRIVVFDRDGNFVKNMGTYGWDPGQIINPVDVAVGANGVWVVDDGNDKVVDVTSASREVSDGRDHTPAGCASTIRTCSGCATAPACMNSTRTQGRRSPSFTLRGRRPDDEQRRRGEVLRRGLRRRPGQRLQLARPLGGDPGRPPAPSRARSTAPGASRWA